nr:hypothetical protein Itr_chr10CG09340 [Ipomoea trifida]GMD40383.1 hypothetical protein Iba_chr10aCG8850 [Ipomoea batatas]GMD45256.1 hypothetical protein Iba_chr10dCG8300 [Ipomoea batatas]
MFLSRGCVTSFLLFNIVHCYTFSLYIPMADGPPIATKLPPDRTLKANQKSFNLTKLLKVQLLQRVKWKTFLVNRNISSL